MKLLLSIMTRILKWGTLVSTFGFIVSTFIQIYARFFLDNAPSWTEEASRFFFLYAMSFAAGLALKDGYYVQLDLLYNKLSKGQKKILELGISILTLSLFIVLGIYSIELIGLGQVEKSPSLKLNMSYAFASIFVMALSIGFFAFLNLWNNIKEKQ